MKMIMVICSEKNTDSDALASVVAAGKTGGFLNGVSDR